MRLGLVARADNTGLGNQTWEFYRHMKPAKTMVIDISQHNGNKQYPERYPQNASFIKGFPNSGDIREFLEGLDCVFFAETPYNYAFYSIAREMGVKTAVQYNYEFFDWFAYPNYPTPDMLIAPSRWHYDAVQKWADDHQIKHVYLHCPVDRQKLPFKPRTQAKRFLHLAGKAAAFDRNGTETVIDASKFVESDVEIVLHFQGEQGLGHQATNSIDEYRGRIGRNGNPDKIRIEQKDYDNYEDIYGEYDVMLLPRRYGGNCLPLNEALSSGMIVFMPDISPNNNWLPPHWLLPAQKVGQFEPRTVVDIYGVDPRELAKRIDWFANNSQGVIDTESRVADALAKQIDWTVMKEMYLKELALL